MTKRSNISIDFDIQTRLSYLKSLGDEYWSFKSSYKRDHSHNNLSSFSIRTARTGEASAP